MALADADEDSSDGEGYVLGVPAVDADGLVEARRATERFP